MSWNTWFTLRWANWYTTCMKLTKELTFLCKFLQILFRKFSALSSVFVMVSPGTAHHTLLSPLLSAWYWVPKLWLSRACSCHVLSMSMLCQSSRSQSLNRHCSQKHPLSTAVLTQSWSEQNWRGLREKPKHLVRDLGNTVLPNLPTRRDGKGTAFAIYFCSFLLHGFSLVHQKRCSLLFCLFLSFAEDFFLHHGYLTTKQHNTFC